MSAHEKISGSCYKQSMKLQSMVTLIVVGGLALGGQARAADIHVGMTSSAGLGCGVYGARAGFNVQRTGLYLLAQECGRRASVGLNFQYELVSNPVWRLYGFFEGTSRATGYAVGGGAGARYRLPNAPLDLFAEVGASRVNTALVGARTEPKITLGALFRLEVPDSLLSGEGFLADLSRPGSIGSSVGCVAVEGAGSDDGVVTDLASQAVTSALAEAASSYAAIFRDISYSFAVGETTVSGNTARVSGTLNLSGTNRLTGEQLAGSFGGFVTLAKTACGWTVTGYQQTGG